MGSRSKHTTARKPTLAPAGQPVRLTAKKRLQLQVRELRRELGELEGSLVRLQTAVRNDLIGLELDLDAVKYVQVAMLGITAQQWDEARENAILVYEHRIAAMSIGIGLREWFLRAPPSVHQRVAELERHYHPERFPAEGAPDEPIIQGYDAASATG